MAYDTAKPPIIIIGMHRSGTSMITRILESLGLFVGARKDDNDEALFFRRINEWIMNISGASWDYPTPCLELFNNSRLHKAIGDYLNQFIRFPHTFEYLGIPKFIRYSTLKSLDTPWGWKDPRNTFTLHFWLHIFPNAKVISIYRHGADVANSLLARHNKHVSLIQSKAYRRRFFARSLLRPAGRFTPLSTRCSTLEGAFSLWEEYMRQAQNSTCNLPNDCLHIQYESFLTNPQKHLQQLLLFSDLKCDHSLICHLAQQIDSSRAWAYKNNSQEGDMIHKGKERLAAWGY